MSLSVTFIVNSVFFSDTAISKIHTLSLHDALPIFGGELDVALDRVHDLFALVVRRALDEVRDLRGVKARSEEHTSELQSRQYLVCRLLLEKKNIQFYFL